MSLTQALNTAISGLNTAQSRIAITSSNISNVNTEGYSRKIAGQETLNLDGVGAGTQVADIYRNVNEGMIREMRGELGKTGREEVRLEFMQRIQTLFGTPQSNGSISQSIGSLADAFEQLGNTPDQNSPRIEAIESALQVLESFGQISDSLQKMRNDIDDKISNEVDNANQLLNQLAELNTSIVRMKNLDQPTTELEDQRDQKLNQLSKILDITTFKRGDGSMVVYSAKGQNTLLDRTPATLSFSKTAGYEPGTGGAGLQLNGEDITGMLQTGTLKGLFEMRDTEIPQLNDQINELAGELRDAINEEHNKGTSFPPPANLSGNRMVSAGDPLAATGTFRIAALDENGQLIANDSWADITLPPPPATVQDALDAINNQLNTAGPPARQYLNAELIDGKMVIEGLDGNRISINEMDSAITTSDGREQGFSHYFGLNDFISTVKRADYMTSSAQTSATNPLGATASTFTLNAGTAPPLAGGITVNYTATDSLEDVRDSIRTALEAAGMTTEQAAETAFIVKDGSRHRLVIDYSENMSITDSGTLMSKIGMTEDQPNLAGNMDVSAAIKNDPSRVVRGQLNADTYETSTAIPDANAALQDYGVGPPPPPAPPTNYTLTVSGDFTDVDIDYDGTTTLQDIADAINNSATLTDNNITAEVKFNSDKGGYELSITDADGDPFYFSDNGAAGESLTEILGLGISFGVHEGDNTAALALSNTFERTDIGFEAAGGLSGETTSLTDYAAGIVATASTKAAASASSYEFQSNLVTDLSTRIQNEAGVNLDEEMSDLIIFQRAYSASARVISTVDELFDTLFNAV